LTQLCFRRNTVLGATDDGDASDNTDTSDE
jgi:hypothetical protein